MEEQNKQDEQISDLDRQLEEIDAYIDQMESDSRDFFENLRISPHQVEELLSDPKRYATKEEFEYIQEQRYRLEAALEQRIADVNASVKREATKPAVKGHWIFVR